jgi:predicted dehydrogenase
MSPLGICVIGAGDLGTVHAQSWLTVPDVKLISVADPLTERSLRNRDRFGFQAACADHLEALDMPGIQVVSVAVPSSLHRQCSEAAMDRGYHVLCEKPIALSVEDARAMLATRDRTGVKLAVGFCKRFMGQVEKVAELVQEGAIGRPCMYRFVTGWERRPKLWIMDKDWGGGPVIDLCCHYIDQMRVIFGSDPVRVKAAGMTLSEGAEELPGVHPEIDTASFTVEYASGDVGALSLTWGLPRGVKTEQVEDLIGPEGAIKVDGVQQITLLQRSGAQVFADLGYDMYARQAQAFAGAIRQDSPVAASAEDGLLALRVSLAALESIRSGEAVAIEKSG